MSTLRFKTRQELGTHPHPFPFPYGEPASGFHPLISEPYLTNALSPYEGKDIIIKNPQTQELREEVQEKAFALGFEWRSGNNRIKNYNADYVIEGGMMMHTPQTKDYDTHIILTPEQFLEGYWPSEFEQNVERLSKYYIGGVDPYSKGPSKGKKADAYLKCGDDITTLGIWHEQACKVMAGDPRDAHKYNLMSEEEFKAKHSPNEDGAMQEKADAYIDSEFTLHAISEGQQWRTDVRDAHKYNLISEEEFKAKHNPNLKFKEWDVTVGDKHIKVGCQEFRKVDVKRFLEFCDRIYRDQAAENVSLDEVFKFIVNNQDKLKL